MFKSSPAPTPHNITNNITKVAPKWKLKQTIYGTVDDLLVLLGITQETLLWLIFSGVGMDISNDEEKIGFEF